MTAFVKYTLCAVACDAAMSFPDSFWIFLIGYT